MTEPAPDLDPDPQARLARLAAALRQPGPDADLDALAAQHGVTPAAARACQDAVSALARAAALADIADSQPVLPEAYEILDELGRGGMGIVYRARHKALDRVVAVKVLRTGEQMFQDLLARFEVEARSLARLRHPHIVAVHDVGRTGGHVYYTMDLIAGTSLERLLAQGALSPTRTVRLMTQVVAAVEHSHEHGVIHRDLKPANILLDGKEDAFVADFGLARDANLPVELTTTGQIMGTPAYMSPESIRGDTQRIGECSDVWALGVVLYQCLTGVSPFAHRALADTMQAVLHADPQPPRRHNPRIPRDLEIVCLKALAKDPDERYATARALREDLERFRDGHPVLAQRPSLGRRVSRWLLRNRAGILSAALAAGFVGGVAVLWPHPVASPAVIDGVIQDAHHRLRDGDHAAALRLYDIARGLLGSDAQRGLRHGGGVTSGSLVDSVWSGMLTCRGELARRRGENGEPGPAADELAPWLEQCPPEVLDIGSAAAELVVLRVLAGQPDAAAAALRRHLVTARDGAAPQLRTREIGMVLDRLAPVFAATEHPRWRDAGAWLATLCQWEVEGVFGGALDPVLMPRDVAAALVAAWAASGPLPETGRTRLANLVRAHVLQQVGSLQWGAPQASTRNALARVAGDTTLAPTVRHLALDTLCAAVDVPWRPGGSVAETEAQLARVVAWAGRDRTPGYVERVRWALELRAAPERRSPVDPATWLADHTGAPADTDWRAWWQRNAARLPQEWLADALAGAGVDVRREAEPAQGFSQLRGASRAWLHHWLTLGVAADARAPLWPAGEAEPANLASSWRSGVRVTDARYRLVFGWTRLGSDGQLPHGGASHARTIELDRPVQTWVGSDVVSSIDFAGPWAALWARAPEWGWRVPGIHGLVHHGANAGERVALDLCLAATDPDVRLKWSASASSTGASGAASGVRPALAAGECGVWLVDGWTVGHDAETAGIGLLALGFERTTATGGETRNEFALANWAERVTTALRRAQAALEQSDAPLADVAHALALLPGEEHGLLDVAARLPLPGALPTLRALDRHAQELRADAATLAQLAALRGGDAAASANVRGLLARFLCARLQCGDATAAGEADFAARLAEAQAILQPGPWWWYRVARITKGAVRQLALERLADLRPPAVLLRVLATEPAASLPAALQQRVAAWQAQETQDQRTGQAAMIGLHGMTLIAAVVALVAVVRARRGGRAVAALGLCAMATLVVDVRFGPWHLPPAAVGAGAVLLTIALWWRLQGGRAVWLAAVLAVAAFGAALLADTGQDAIAAGCASILALAALAGLAMSLGAHQRRWLRCLAWSTAAVLLVATTATAYVGLRALYLGVASDSLDAVILASPVAGWVRPAAIAGVLGLAAVLAAVMVVGAETQDRSRRGARPA